MTARIVLVRHGETTGESSIRLNGSTDVPLSDHGRAQVRAARAALAAEAWTQVLTTPLCRARETARLLAPEAEAVVVAGFTEIDFGRWERLTYAECEARDPEIYREMGLGRAEFCFPGGESRLAFQQRVRVATHDFLAGVTAGTVLVAAHKGTIKGITATLLGRDWGLVRAEACDLASIHVFERQGQGWERTTHNRTDHLGALWQPDHPPTR